ncbi:MAG: RsmB/NOP family class I SAM-dependent RNA methyltransferase [Rhodobacter sp.]|nr:RsmB/NOP family class I SAM-dependent RNA methyltransferase [Rhodobacter sp.]
MTPAARIAAAIGILDAVLAGEPAEKLLTTWARRNRYAGSGDRAAIRDHVYDAIRCQRSFAWLGGGATGRGLMLGALRAAGTDPAEIFTGQGYGPDPLAPDEVPASELAGAPLAVQLDLPDWLLADLTRSLGDDLVPVAQALRHRAPVFLRVNLARASVEQAVAALAGDGIGTAPHDLSATALQVVSNPRRVQTSQAFRDGLVELQDVASQAVVDALPRAARVLDYCAGGGGKSLALAARGADVVAHDSDAGRMGDIAVRAARAGVSISISTDLTENEKFDLVLCDVPCSGSGAWRRAPQAKWQLTEAGLAALRAMQASILDTAQHHVGPGGTLAYATCSLMACENQDRISRFLAGSAQWSKLFERQFTPLDGGDGFYVCCLKRGED